MLLIEDIFIDPETNDLVYEDSTLKTTTNNVSQALAHLVATLQGEQILSPDTGTRWMDFLAKDFVNANFINAVNTALTQDNRFRNIQAIDIGYDKRTRKQYVTMKVQAVDTEVQIYTLLG